MAGEAVWYQGWPGPPTLPFLLVLLYLAFPTNTTFVDQTGTRFLLGFIENRFLVEQPRPKVFVVTASSQTATVSITVPFSTYPEEEFTVTPGTGIEHTFDYDMQLFDSGINYDKVALVESDVPVVVSGANLNDRSSDAYLVLPEHALGSEYIVMSYVFNGRSTGQQQGPSSAIILAPQDVEVTVQFPDIADLDVSGVEHLLKENVLHVSLSQYDAFQMRSKFYRELTGARITSTGPVSVVAGSMWTSVGRELMGDHLIENLPPVNTWGTSFYTVPLANRTGGDIIRVLGHTEGTQVRVLQEDPDDPTSIITSILPLNAHHFVDIDSPSDMPLVILASRRVLVAQFCKSHSVDNFRYSDPFMAIIPPATQYLNRYYFMTTSTRSGQTSFYNYLNIVCDTSKLSGLRLNDLSISTEDLQWGWVTVPTSPMSAAIMPIANGTYVLLHIDPTVTFSAMLYGFQWQESYGMLLGQSMRALTYKENCLQLQQEFEDFFDNDCDGLFDEEIENGIDDDGDGLIDEDVFNDKRARSQNSSNIDTSGQKTFVSTQKKLTTEQQGTMTGSAPTTILTTEKTTMTPTTTPTEGQTTTHQQTTTEGQTTTPQQTTTETFTTTEQLTTTERFTSTYHHQTSTKSITTMDFQTTTEPLTTREQQTTTEFATTTTEVDQTPTQTITTSTKILTTTEVTTVGDITTVTPSTTTIPPTEVFPTTEATTTTPQTMEMSTQMSTTTEVSTTAESSSTVGMSTSSTPEVTTRITTQEPTTTITQLATTQVATTTEVPTTTSETTTGVLETTPKEDVLTKTTTDAASTQRGTLFFSAPNTSPTATTQSITILDMLSTVLQVTTSTQITTQTQPITDSEVTTENVDVTTEGTMTSAGQDGRARTTITSTPYSFSLLRDDPLMIVIPFVILICVPLFFLTLLIIRSALAARRERAKVACPPKVPPPKPAKAKTFKPKPAIVDCR